jgi:N-acetyl-anhydromuramyl-L-alanine amidase AmpD
VQPIDTSNIDPMTRIYRLTVHHSGEEGDVIEDPIEALRHFERIHKQAKGWACIGYHFVIARDGRVFEGRPLKYQGAHAVGDNNIGNIGVCLIGDFDKGPVPPAQKAALIDVLDRLTKQYGIEKSQIFGHREFKATDCPGRYLMAIVEQYRGSGSGEVGPQPSDPRSSSSTNSSKPSSKKKHATH